VNSLRRGPGAGGFDDAAVADLRAAIRSAAAEPDSLQPREQFVADLHRNLRADADRTPAAGTAAPGMRRRRVLQVAAGAIGAVALGAAGEGVAEQLRGTPRGNEALLPSAGRWTAVATTAQVPAGSVIAFTVAGVAGVVANEEGRLGAVSAVCTHQGCLLRLNAAQRRLDCPCHSAAFSLSGALLHDSLPNRPRPLPQLDVREVSDRIEVLLPPT